MRREGYEFAVSKPEVLYHTDERGKKLEPMEIAYVDVPEEFSGTVIQKLSERKGELQGMSTASDGSVRLEFHIPSRGLIGFRGEFLTSTKGTGILNTTFDGYAPYKGDFQYRKQGLPDRISKQVKLVSIWSVLRTGSWNTFSLDLVKKYTAVWSSDRMVKLKTSN